MGRLLAGADRCKGEWVVAGIGDDGTYTVDVVAHIETLWRAFGDAELILLDVPIGLLDRGPDERLCDTAARRVLGERRSSVFPAPCRQALTAASYNDACAVNEQATGRQLSKQSWAIVPVIREVDEFLSQHHEARQRIREMHPEVCFWGLACGQPLQHYKKTEEGFHERLDLLAHYYPHAEEVVRRAMAKYQTGLAARDDIVDALAGAVTALAGEAGLATLPDVPDTDGMGLRMEMVYRRF